MYGSARPSSSPPRASLARVTDALADFGVDDDPRAAIAGLIRATPKRMRPLSAGSDDSNTVASPRTSPAASSAAAAAADVIARARAAAVGEDAVWVTAKAAVDAVAAATRPATFEGGERTKRKGKGRLFAGDAAHVVARAASARAEHAAEVAAAAAVHAAAAAAFARASPGASADEEASAAARLADDAADVATRAAGDATAAAARAERTSARIDSLRLTELQGASVWTGDCLPPTPPAVARRDRVAAEGVRASDGDDGETPRAAPPPSPTSARRAPAGGETRSELRDFSPSPRAPGSLGKPRRVPISERDALLFDAAEAKLRLRNGRRKAAAAFAAAERDADARGGLDARAAATRAAERAVARALESAGAAPSRRAERLPTGRAIPASRRATDAMDAAEARRTAREERDRGDRNETAANGVTTEAEGGREEGPPRGRSSARASAAATTRGGKLDGNARARYDPGSFAFSLVNAHTRFHGEMTRTDKRRFETDPRAARLPRTSLRAAAARGAALGGGDAGGGEADAGRDARRVGPRPTKKSRAAAAAAAERARLAAEARAARLREAEAVAGSFAPFRASPAPSPAKPAQPTPVRGARRSLHGGARGAEKKQAPFPIRRASPNGKNDPAKTFGSPSDRLVAARVLLADLKSGLPLDPDARFDEHFGASGPKSTWHELKEAGRRSVARVRAYQSAEGSPPGAIPAHERYQHYKMMGFGGMGAKTSWAR